MVVCYFEGFFIYLFWYLILIVSVIGLVLFIFGRINIVVIYIMMFGFEII